MTSRFLGLIFIALVATPVSADDADDIRRSIDDALAKYQTRIDEADSRYRSSILGKLRSRSGEPVEEQALFRLIRQRKAHLERDQQTVARLLGDTRADRISSGRFGHQTDEIFIAATRAVWDVTLDETRLHVQLMQQEYAARANALRERLSKEGAGAGPEIKAQEQTLRAETSTAFRELAARLGRSQRSTIADVKQWGEAAKAAGRPNVTALTEGLIEDDLALTTSGGFRSALETFIDQQSVVLLSVVLPGSERLSLKEALLSLDAEPEQEVLTADFILDGPAFRLVTGIHPAEPIVGAPVTLGFRLRNLPDYPARGVVLKLLFLTTKANEDGEERLTFLESVETDDNRCTADGRGVFTCKLGDIEYAGHTDFVFRTTLPENGVQWSASWDTKDGVANGVATGTFKPSGPQITEVLVLGNQTGDYYGVPSYPYPYGPGRKGMSTRTLFLVGRGLPERGDPFETTSVDPSVIYHFIAWPDSDNRYHKELYEHAWATYRTQARLRDEDPIPEGLQGLLVRATLNEGILPGDKELTLNEGAGVWTLGFGDLKLEIEFIREHARPLFLQDIYVPDRARVWLRTSRELPLDEIPVNVFEQDRQGNSASHRLVATRHDVDARVYMTRPIHLVERGRPHMAIPAGVTGEPPVLTIDVDLGNGTPVMLLAEVDAGFRTASLRIPCDPHVASARVLRGPRALATMERRREALGTSPWRVPFVMVPTDRPTLFTDALFRAAKCARVDLQSWDQLSEKEADSFRNLVVLTTQKHIRETKITLGEHAATILLRDMFAFLLKEQAVRINEMIRDDLKVLGFLNYMSAFWHDDTYPVNLIEVESLDGEQTTYGRAVALDDVETMAQEYGKTTEEIQRWRFDATRNALAKLIEETVKLREEVLRIEECDVEELLMMTGRGFDPVIRALIPRLMTLEEATAKGKRHLYWTPDESARRALDRIAILSERLRKQRQKANLDTQITLAVVGFLAMPLMLSEAAGVALFCLAFDLVDLGVSAAIDISEYLASETELEFSRRAMVVIGHGRHELAQAEAVGWAGVLFNVGVSAAFVGLSAADVLRLIGEPNLIARGRMLTRTLDTKGIADMSKIERRNFGAFSIRSKVRQKQVGMAGLTDLERQAIRTVEQYKEAMATKRGASAGNTPDPLSSSTPDAPSASGPDAPPSSGSSSSRPAEANSVEMDYDIESGRAEMATEVGPEPEAARRGADATPASATLDAAGVSDLDMRIGPEDAWHHLRHRVIEFETTGGGTVILDLREHIGSGTFAVVFEIRDQTSRTRNLVAKFVYRDSATEFGRNVVQAIASRHIRVAERMGVIPVQQAPGVRVLTVEILEHLPETLSGRMARTGRRPTPEMLQALSDGLHDLNRSGHAWLDIKTNNFGFERVDGRLRVVIHDTGAIVKVSSAAEARRLQEYTLMPLEQIDPEFANFPIGVDYQGLARRPHIEREFEPHVRPADNDGRALAEEGFNPIIGGQLPELWPVFRGP